MFSFLLKQLQLPRLGETIFLKSAIGFVWDGERNHSLCQGWLKITLYKVFSIL